MSPTRQKLPSGLSGLCLKRILPCLALLLLLACYDSDPIDSAAPSPDGRFLALLTVQHELGVLDLARLDPIKVYTHQAGDGLAWSPDGRNLAYIDKPGGGPYALQGADIYSGQIQTLVQGSDWKASPAWLEGGRVAFLSERGKAGVGVWVVDLKSRATAPLITLPNDICHLWASPTGTALAFETITSGSAELWLWRAADPRLRRLTPPAPRMALTELNAAFAPDGRHLAYSTLAPGRAELVWVDAVTGEERRRQTLAKPVRDLAVTGAGCVAAGQGDALALWRPEAHWYQRRLTRSDWNGMPLTVLGGRGAAGLALALQGSIILTAADPARLTAGQLQPRHLENLLALAWGLAQQGRLKADLELLNQFQARATKGSHDEYLIAVGWAQLARLQGNWRISDQWLARAIHTAAPGGVEEESVWLERLALAAFNAQDRPLANWILEQMPAGLDQSALAAWTRQMTEYPDRATAGAWMAIGNDLRTQNNPAAAHLVNKLVCEAEPTTLTLQGVSLILGGDFEPLGEVDSVGQRRLEAMLGQPEFQVALLTLLRRNQPGGPTPGDLSALLLGQWVRQGDLNSARELVRDSLREGVASSLAEYQEMLRRFLVLEEADPLRQQAVTAVLLAPDIAQTLARWLKEPEDRLTLRLAQVKKALIDGTPDQAQAWLAEARTLERRVKAPRGGEGAYERAQTTFLTELFAAKLAERDRKWAAATQGYRACQALMDATPGSWEVSSFETAFMAELLELGAARDPDLLKDYLAILRHAGDPLINPSHAPQDLDTGLKNLATLARVAPEQWIQPYLYYAQGLYLSLGQQSWRALDYLERALRQNPPPALKQRILLEVAAVRDGLGQHERAAAHYRALREMGAPAPQRVAAIAAEVQSESSCGAVQSAAERLKDILQDDRLPQPWKAWLWMQQGSGGDE